MFALRIIILLTVLMAVSACTAWSLRVLPIGIEFDSISSELSSQETDILILD